MLFLLACTAPGGDTAADTPVDLVASLADAGPWNVGYRESSVTYADPVAGGERTLRLALWFPTDAESGGDAAYLGGAIPAEGVLDDPEPAAGTLPVVLFSHGHQGYAENSGFLMEHLASHGYAVAAPDHTGNTTFDGGDRDTEIYLQRPHDLSAVLDALPAELDVDASTAPVLGHSFGGYTAMAIGGATYDPDVIAACTPEASSFCSTMTDELAAQFAAGAHDARISALVPMAAGDSELFGDGAAAVTLPTLLMTGEVDGRNGVDGGPYWTALQGGDNRHLVVLGGGHQVFTDFSGVLEDGGTVDVEEAFRAIRAYALAAVRAAGGDDTVRPVLDGEVEVSEVVVLER